MWNQVPKQDRPSRPMPMRLSRINPPKPPGVPTRRLQRGVPRGIGTFIYSVIFSIPR
jgi:hypothetical protein